MKKNVGFTLMEILITVGILALVSVVLAQVLFTTAHANKKTELITEIKLSGNFSLDVISRMVRGASAIQTSCTNGASAATSVTITNPDTFVTTIECLSDGSAARIASVSGTNIAYLSPGTLTLDSTGGNDCGSSSLTFSCPPDSGIQNQLMVTFTLGPLGLSGSAYESGSSSFQSTVDMRN